MIGGPWSGVGEDDGEAIREGAAVAARGDGEEGRYESRGEAGRPDGSATTPDDGEPDSIFWIAQVISPAITGAAIVVPVHLTLGRFNQWTNLVRIPADGARDSIDLLPVGRPGPPQGITSLQKKGAVRAESHRFETMPIRPPDKDNDHNQQYGRTHSLCFGRRPAPLDPSHALNCLGGTRLPRHSRRLELAALNLTHLGGVGEPLPDSVIPVGRCPLLPGGRRPAVRGRGRRDGGQVAEIPRVRRADRRARNRPPSSGGRRGVKCSSTFRLGNADLIGSSG